MTSDEARKKVCVALDVPDSERACKLAKQLVGCVGMFKVGMELYTSTGPEIIRALTLIGVRLFLDLKFHDIPNTVAAVSRIVAPLGVEFFNLHASGGPEMMRAAATAASESAARSGKARPKVLAVTVLTSIDDRLFEQISRASLSVSSQVEHLARMAKDAGIDGVVASPQEIRLVRVACGPDFLIVTPGVRPAGDQLGDQKRVLTPGEAVKMGADVLVIGRPITAANDPVAAAEKIVAEIQNA